MRISLRLKMMLGVLLPLSLALGAFAYTQYNTHRSHELATAARTATALGRAIEGSLTEAMLDQDLATIQKSIDNIAANPQVRDMFLLNTRSEVRAAPGGRDVGRTISITENGCIECHTPNSTNQSRYSAVLTVPGVGQVLRNCNPIANKPVCYACHDPADRYNGVLITDLSLQAMDQHLGEDLWRSLLFLGGALLLGALMLGATMDPIVVKRVDRLTALVRAFSRGDLSQRADFRSGDELGELAEAFNRMAEGMEEKARLEYQVRQRTAELERLYAELQEKEAVRAQLLKQIISAQEAERKRIARELHDELAQSLTGLIMSLDSTEDVLGSELQSVHAQLARTREISARALEQTRQLILDLRPTMLDDLGLVPAIRWYAATHLASTGATVTFQTEGRPRRLRPELETALFRVAQEAINNVARHAHPGNVQICLTWEPRQVKLEVKDDGQGFDMQTVYAQRDTGAGMGLLGMQERVEMFGGQLEISSQPSGGTRVKVQLPTNGGVMFDANSGTDR